MLEVKYIDLPTFPVEPLVRNPFRHPVLKGQWAAAIRCFDTRHKDLVGTDRRDGRSYQHRGNSWATHFWWGFNGAHDRNHYRGSYDTPAYACWVAGKAVRKAIERKAAC